MGDKLVHYRTFENEETARTVLLDLLDSYNIPYEGVELQKNNDHHLTAVVQKPGYAVNIRPEDFSKVEELMDNLAAEELKDLDNNHYLYQFSIDELKEIIRNPYEWSANDVAIAVKLLNDVGYKVTLSELDVLKRKHYERLSQPSKAEVFYLIRVYLSALLGGFLAIIEGRHLFKSTKILPDGKQVFEYDNATRNHGVIIYWVGIVCLMCWIGFFISRIFRT